MSGLSIKDGAKVDSGGGCRFTIMQLIGFDYVVARDIETDDLVRLAVVDLNAISAVPSTVAALPNLSKVSDRDWAGARRRLNLIAPLLDGTRCPRGHRRAGPSRWPGWLDALPRVRQRTTTARSGAASPYRIKRTLVPSRTSSSTIATRSESWTPGNVSRRNRPRSSASGHERPISSPASPAASRAPCACREHRTGIRPGARATATNCASASP